MDYFGFEKEVCCVCGCSFGMPAAFLNKRREDGKSFFCPNGHSLSFRDTTLNRLTRERDLLKQRLAEREDAIACEKRMREAAERQASAARGQVTKLKKRASAGVCPCCNRTFKNMAEHMKSKHPTFLAEAAE